MSIVCLIAWFEMQSGVAVLGRWWAAGGGLWRAAEGGGGLDYAGTRAWAGPGHGPLYVTNA